MSGLSLRCVEPLALILVGPVYGMIGEVFTMPTI